MTLPLSKQTLIGDSHALGHPQIDMEHFAISDCWSQAIRAEPIGLQLTIARLRKVMHGHFDHEAKLIEAAGTPFCGCHRDEHDEMIGLCDDAYALATRDWRASRSDISPLEVDRMATPSPLRTRGISCTPTYWRRPGDDTRFSSRITGSPPA